MDGILICATHFFPVLWTPLNREVEPVLFKMADTFVGTSLRSNVFFFLLFAVGDNVDGSGSSLSLSWPGLVNLAAPCVIFELISRWRGRVSLD